MAENVISINTAKSYPSTHLISGDKNSQEFRDLKRRQKLYDKSPYVFMTERKGPLTASTVRKMIARAGIKAGIEFPLHPHMLRHSTGYKLANDGQDTRAIQVFMGHRNIQHTVRYTELSPNRFKGFWSD